MLPDIIPELIIIAVIVAVILVAGKLPQWLDSLGSTVQQPAKPKAVPPSAPRPVPAPTASKLHVPPTPSVEPAEQFVAAITPAPPNPAAPPALPLPRQPATPTSQTPRPAMHPDGTFGYAAPGYLKRNLGPENTTSDAWRNRHQPQPPNPQAPPARRPKTFGDAVAESYPEPWKMDPTRRPGYRGPR